MENITKTNLETAKEYMSEYNYTLVLAKGNKILTSHDKGIKPLLDFCEFEVSFSGYACADKVVGKGAALLYVYLGITDVYAKTISKHALTVLKNNNINVEYDTLVDKIKDRTGKGFCPIETSVLNCNDPNEALTLIKNKLEELSQ